MEHYIKKIEYKGVNIDNINKLIVGFGGAQVKDLVNKAMLTAIGQGRQKADNRDFEEALDKILMGNKTRYNEGELRQTAIHEVGHAIMTQLDEQSPPIYKVTILSRGGSLGHTSFLPNYDD